MPDYMRGIGLLVPAGSVLKTLCESLPNLKMTEDKADQHFKLLKLRRFVLVNESEEDLKSPVRSASISYFEIDCNEGTIIWLFSAKGHMLKLLCEELQVYSLDQGALYARILLTTLLASLNRIRKTGAVINIGAMSARLSGEVQIGAVTLYSKKGASAESSQAYALIAKEFTTTPSAFRLHFASVANEKLVMFCDGHGNFTLAITQDAVGGSLDGATYSIFCGLIGDLIECNALNFVGELPMKKKSELIAIGMV